jgi:hypothetical protein
MHRQPSADLDKKPERLLTGGKFFRARDTAELSYQLLDAMEPTAQTRDSGRSGCSTIHWRRVGYWLTDYHTPADARVAMAA